MENTCVYAEARTACKTCETLAGRASSHCLRKRHCSACTLSLSFGLSQVPSFGTVAALVPLLIWRTVPWRLKSQQTQTHVRISPLLVPCATWLHHSFGMHDPDALFVRFAILVVPQTV